MRSGRLEVAQRGFGRLNRLGTKAAAFVGILIGPGISRIYDGNSFYLGGHEGFGF
jgi:hypothetical protein